MLDDFSFTTLPHLPCSPGCYVFCGSGWREPWNRLASGKVIKTQVRKHLFIMARKLIKYVCTKASGKEVKRKHTATHNGIVNDEGHWNGKLTFNLAWCIQMSRPICRNLWEHLQAKSFDAGEQETHLQTIYKQRQSLLFGSIKPNKTNNTPDLHGRINQGFLNKEIKKTLHYLPFLISSCFCHVEWNYPGVFCTVWGLFYHRDRSQNWRLFSSWPFLGTDT